MKTNANRIVDEPVEFTFHETPSGEVIVTMPTGETFFLQPDSEDAYHRESLLAARVADAITKKLNVLPRAGQPKPAPPALMGEHLYTPQELAPLASLHVTTVRRMFIDEPGVIIRGKRNRRDGKRDYVTLRIPASVAERKLRGLMEGKVFKCR
jgi:hypothetical protein